jgi:hypothetical protein
MNADLILIDERKWTSVALTKGFAVTGTLGILRVAAQGGLIDIAQTLAALCRCYRRIAFLDGVRDGDDPGRNHSAVPDQV